MDHLNAKYELSTPFHSWFISPQ